MRAGLHPPPSQQLEHKFPRRGTLIPASTKPDHALGISVSAPFVWRCLTGAAVAPFPHPAHRTGHADFPRPALGQGLPPSPTTHCELRSLPSTGVTRLPRYYEPLRHPAAPGLSLTGLRLDIPAHATGF